MGAAIVSRYWHNQTGAHKALPVDKERYKTTTYKIATTQKNNISYAEKGKWYLLEPTASGVQPKLIGIDLPTFGQGTL